MSKVSQEELQKSLQYLEDFEKSQTSSAMGEEENGGQEEKINLCKEKLTSCLRKAKKYKEALDKLEKGEDVEIEEDEENEEGEEIQKGNKKMPEDEPNIEEGLKKGNDSSPLVLEDFKKEIISSITKEMQSFMQKSFETEIKDLKEKVEDLEKSPIQKSLQKSAQSIILQKKALAGEPTDDGKIVLSKKLNKGKISDILFEAWSSENDEIKKSQYAEAVMQFESTGSYISPFVQADLLKSKNIQIIE